MPVTDGRSSSPIRHDHRSGTVLADAAAPENVRDSGLPVMAELS
jgi:hypothetical protein